MADKIIGLRINVVGTDDAVKKLSNIEISLEQNKRIEQLQLQKKRIGEAYDAEYINPKSWLHKVGDDKRLRIASPLCATPEAEAKMRELSEQLRAVERQIAALENELPKAPIFKHKDVII